MTFDWNKAAESDFTPMSEGYHRVKVIKAHTTNKDGETYKTSKGDPFVRVIMENADEETVSEMFTCNKANAWKIASFFVAAGVDPQKLVDSGVEPEDFAKQAVAEKQFVGRELWVQVSHKQRGGKTYAEPGFMKEDDVPPAVVQQATASAAASGKADADDIPF